MESQKKSEAKLCEFCNERKATAWFQTKRICEICWKRLKYLPFDYKKEAKNKLFSF